MTYIIGGYGTAGLGSDAKKELLRDAQAVSSGTMTLAQAQANWDARAKPMRIILTNQILGSQANPMNLRRLTPAQIAVEVEKQVVSNLGARPKGPASAPPPVVFSSQGTEVVAGEGGIKTLHIVGGVSILLLIVLAVKGT